jgi:hypothetical protein
MKESGGDKPIGVIIHKETPCVVTLISKKLKCHVFHFILPLFSPTKSENRRNKSFPGWGAGTGTSGREVLGKWVEE